MAQFALAGQIREELGKAVYDVREAGMIPGVVYGGAANMNVKVPRSAFEALFDKAGENSIVDLTVGDKTVPVLIYEIQRHPTTHLIIHVDFYEVDMNKEITANVPLNYVGIAPALKLGGTLLQNLDEVEIRCLPKDLIHEITVDVSVLKTFDDNIHVGDLQLPEGVTFETSEDVLVAKVAEVREEVEAAVVDEAAAVAAVQKEEKKEAAPDEAAS